MRSGLLKVVLQGNQWFYILYNAKPIEIKTLFQSNTLYNIATDSLKVLKSEVNKMFYEFQHLQQQLNVANYFLLQMMRLYPLPDPFHKQIEGEYFKRYVAMAQFVKILNKSFAAKVALAYYQPVNPDWKQPDMWRDSIIAAHYFDYFNPADNFYLHTNILSEKMDIYLALRANKRDAYGQAVYDESIITSATQDFLEKIKTNQANFEFCLNYLLKKFNKEHKENIFLFLHDRYLKNEKTICEPSTNRFNWARERAGILKGVQVGSIAPDFNIAESKLNLHQLSADYTLIIFWASWCPHCAEEVPKIKKAIESFPNQQKEKSLASIFISLDNEEKSWKDFIKKNELSGYINLCEFKGWNGQIGKSYNVYATPTMFLLDKNKKIIAKPENAEQLINNLTTINN